MFVAPREGLLVRLLLVSDSLVRLLGSSGFESGSERSRFPWLASIVVFFGRIWDVLAGWLGGDLGAAPNTYLGCALGCSERTLVVSVASVLCLWFVLGLSLMCLWCVSERTLVVSVASMLCLWFVLGLSLMCLWCVSGVSWVRLWLVSGLSLACLWLVSGLSLVCLWLVLSVCTITFVYLLPSPSVWFACTINSADPLLSIHSEYPLLLGLFVWFACTIHSADPLLPISFVCFVCTIHFANPPSTLEQGKRSSPKILCRGPSGVLTNPVFDLSVRAL